MSGEILQYPEFAGGATVNGVQAISPFGWVNTIIQGNRWFVKPRTGSDSNDGKSPSSAFKTLAKAQAVAVANQNDIVFLLAESNTAADTTDYQATALTWAKNSVHLIGVNNGGMIGQRSRISNLSTATAIVDGLFIVSANNCFIANIEVFQGQGGTNPTGASIATLVSGDRNHFANCQISGIGHSELDDATSRSLKVSGSENFFDSHCYIGLDTVIRATATAEVEISAGARNVFDRCHFETYTSLSTFKMVTVATGCDRFIKFLDCDFHAVQNITSAVAPTGLIGITTMNGAVLMKNPYVYGFAQIVTADNAYVQVLGLNGLATGHLIGIAQGVDAA